MAESEHRLIGLGAAAGDWRIVNLTLVRVRIAQKRGGDWTGMIEVRARMEKI